MIFPFEILGEMWRKKKKKNVFFVFGAEIRFWGCKFPAAIVDVKVSLCKKPLCAEPSLCEKK